MNTRSARAAGPSAEPFVFIDVLEWPTPPGEGIFFPSAGLNIHINPCVVSMRQYTYMVWFDLHKGLRPAIGGGAPSHRPTPLPLALAF